MNIEKHRQAIELFKYIATEMNKTLSRSEQESLISTVASRNPRLWVRSEGDATELTEHMTNIGLLASLGEFYRILAMHLSLADMKITDLIDYITASVEGGYANESELLIVNETAKEILHNHTWIVALYVYRMATFENP